MTGPHDLQIRTCKDLDPRTRFSTVERSCFVHVCAGVGCMNGCRPDGSSSNPYRSMEGGSVAELLDVTIECPALDQLQVEVGRTLEDRVPPGLTGDDREERHLHAVDQAGGH